MPPPKDPEKYKEYCERRSEISKKMWEDPNYKIKHDDGIKKTLSDPLVREKMSIKAKERWMDENYRNAKITSLTGKVVSEETKEKHRDTWRQPGFREQWLGTNNPAKKPEVRMKMRKAKLGTIVPEKTRKLMSESHIGLERTKEHCENLSKVWEQPGYRESHSGSGSTNWKGGISFEPYCPKFTNEFKERVRAFFDYTCQFPGCNHIWQVGETKLAVHHVNYRKDSCCNENITPLFVPVCSGSCHMKTNHNREYYEQYFTTLINEKYNGKCYFTKEEMALRYPKK
jgi:hypothetical protein